MRNASPRIPLKLAALLGVLACGPGTVDVEDPVPTTLSVSATSVILEFFDQTTQLSASVRDQNGGSVQSTIEWSIDDATVATVSSNGLVQAVSNGTATVTVSGSGLTAMVQVTVEQLVSELTVLSGADQSGTVSSALATPVTVQAVDRGGSVVANRSLSFTPEAGDGSVDAASVQTDANGEASVTWTLGAGFGPQQLVVSADGVDLQIGAFALDVTPRPDLALSGAVPVDRADPTSLEEFSVSATVRNQGDGSTGAGYRVSILADGNEVGFVDAGPLAPGEEEVVSVDVAPIASGSRQLTVIADALDAITELVESNNEVARNLLVREQTAVAIGGSVSSISATNNVEVLFRVDIPQDQSGTLTVELTGGTGDVDLYIEGGTRPSERPQYNDCISAGSTSTEACQVAFASGSFTILLHAFTSFSGVTMNVGLSNTTEPYDIELVFLSNGTPEQDDAVREAAQRWMDIIPVGVPDVDFSQNPVPADACINGQAEINTTVDDLIVYVTIGAIDGPFGVLARAGPCTLRGVTELPILGRVQFDQEDLDRLDQNGDMVKVVVHEIGHALGIGTIWDNLQLLKNPSLPNNQGADTHFSGSAAIAAFDAAGGSTFSGSKVPVENMAGEGSGDSHWREAVLATEIMTPSLNSQVVNPVSAITIASLEDLGYIVDLTQADAYTVVNPAPPRGPIAGVPGFGAGVIDLRGDIWRGPVAVVDENGRIVEVRY